MYGLNHQVKYLIKVSSISSQGAKAAYSRENSLRHESDIKSDAAASST